MAQKTVSVDIPESLHAVAGDFAQQSGMTVEQLLASALAEKLSALAGREWFEARAARGSRAKFDEVMRLVPDVEPEERDRLPSKVGRTPPSAPGGPLLGE